MRRSLKEKVLYIGQMIGDQSTDKKTLIKDWINNAREKISQEVKLPNLIKEKIIPTIARYTTGTVSITEGTTTITGVGTTFTQAMVGRSIRIGTDLTIYTIKSFTNTATIDIDQPKLGGDASGDTFTIFQDKYALPDNCGRILTVKRLPNARELTKILTEEFVRRWPDILTSAAGDPNWYRLYGNDVIKEPITGANTADTSTSTTQIIDSALSGTYAEYYDGYYVYNSTRGETRKVIAFDVSTTTLTLESAITGQVAGDSYTLSRPVKNIGIYPVPSSAIAIYVQYIEPIAKLVNDNEFSVELPEEYDQIDVLGAIAEASKFDEEVQKRGLDKGDFDDMKQKLKIYINSLGNQIPVLSGGNPHYADTHMPGTWPDDGFQ